MPSEFVTGLQRELAEGLARIEARGRRRDLAEIAGVNLSSNDYLGLAENPALKEATAAAVRESPRAGGTGSRLLSGHSRVWDELEQEFAEFAGTEAALYFGSGYAANLGLLTSLLRKDDVVFSDELNHASLIDGIRLSGAQKVIIPHLDLGSLERALLEHVRSRCRKIIVTESVFSMDGDVADIDALVRLADRHGAGVLVDEAHATCVHGRAGRARPQRDCHDSHLRKGAGERGSVCLRKRDVERPSDQSRADIYLLNGHATLHGRANPRSPAARKEDGYGAGQFAKRRERIRHSVAAGGMGFGRQHIANCSGDHRRR